MTLLLSSSGHHGDNFARARPRRGEEISYFDCCIALLRVSVPTAVCLLRDASLRSDDLPTSEEFCFGETFGVFKVSR